MPSGNLLLAPMTTQEAVQSSRIEGAMSTLDDVYETEAGDKAERAVMQEDVNEVLNYRNALEYGTACLAERGITLGLIREMHTMLLDGVRGQGKKPGGIRETQNWIGRRGCTLSEASYVPPAPERLTDYLENWVGYAHAQDLDPLLKAGIQHAQFELIHPFHDGNGRVFIPLYLTSTGVLDAPNFYLSEYFEQHRDEYTGALNQLHRIIDSLEQAGVFTVRRSGSGRKPTLCQLPELTLIAEGKPRQTLRLLRRASCKKA